MSGLGPLGIAVPQGSVDRASLTRVAEQFDALGVDAVWTLDQAQGPAPTLEPIATLALVAALTSRVRLGIGVLGIASRNPLNLAKSLATLDHLSGGRLEAGFGLGDLDIYADQGIAPHPPGSFADALLSSLLDLWRGERITRNVGPFQLDGVVTSPVPLQEPHPPLWIGGRADNGLRRAAALGQGWMGAGVSTLAQFESDVFRLRQVLADHGRDPADFGIAKRLYLQVTGPDPSADRRRVEDWFQLFYGDTSRMGACVIGPPQACVEAITALFEAGAGHVVLHPVLDAEVQQQLLAEHVLDEVR